ncbi:inositol monophosphatase, partial [Pelagibacteraceae bacterium]|nr:inositol monophosphatase [Pelagibacteraceae bacterium]
KEYIKISNSVDAPIRKFGSASLDLVSVACGRFDGYWQSELNYWDIAAGIVILKEAGGYIDFIENSEKNPIKKNIIATNSKIHQELSDVLLKKNIE